MNLRDFEYIVTLADTRHFGRAADKCNVSQPTLSAQIKKLEEYLGVAIFERDNKNVFITVVGKEIISRAERALTEARDMVEYAKNSGDPLAGEYRLGAFPTLAPYIFPGIIAQVNKKLPQLTLALVEEKTDALIAKLKAGELDAALLALPVTRDGLTVKALFDDPFYVAAPKNHPLAAKKSVSPEEFASHNPMLLEEGHCLREQAIELCRLTDAAEGAFRAAGLETVRRMTAAGYGLTLIPELAADKDKNITYVPFDAPSPKRRIALVRRTQSVRSEAFSAIADIVKDVKASP